MAKLLDKHVERREARSVISGQLSGEFEEGWCDDDELDDSDLLEWWEA